MLEISVSVVQRRSSELLTLSSLIIIIVIEIGRCVCVYVCLDETNMPSACTLRVGIRIAKFD